MPNYECKRCGYIINRITNYSKHINTKRICKAIFLDTDRSLLLDELDKYKKLNLKCGIISKLNHKWTTNEPQKTMKIKYTSVITVLWFSLQILTCEDINGNIVKFRKN